MRDKIRMYVNGWFRNCRTISDFVAEAHQLIAEGFTAIKWEPFKTISLDSDEKLIVREGLKCVAAVREAVGPEIDLLIEMHGLLSYDGALEFIRGVEEYHPMFLEEPIHPDDREGYRKLALKSNLPIAAGERSFTRWSYKQILQDGNLSIIQPDVTHMGGLFETKKTAAMAEPYYVKVAPHNSNGPVATIASAILDATLPNFLIQEFLIENIQLNQTLFKSGYEYQNGHIILNDRPGLGIEPDFEAMASGEYRNIQSVGMNNFNEAAGDKIGN